MMWNAGMMAYALAVAVMVQPPRAATARTAIGAVPHDSVWRGTFSMVERVTLNADTVEELDGTRRRAAVGMQVNIARSQTLRSERVIRLEGTLVPRIVVGRDASAQTARLVASYASHLKSTELMPTRVRCTTNGAERLATVVRTMETSEKGSAEVEDEVTATNVGIEVLGPSLTLTARMASEVVGDDACEPRRDSRNANVARTEFEHAQDLERYSVSIALDPRNPNISVGSKVEREGNVMRTWVWALTRGPADDALHIERMTFEQHVYPDSLAWHAVGPSGIVDGNVVRVRITVRNDGERTVGDILSLAAVGGAEAREARRLRGLDGTEAQWAVQVAPRSSKTVEFLWDTHGWAWEPNLRAASQRVLEARSANGSPGGEMVRTPMLVVPRPVVLVHGLWSDASTWKAYRGFLAEAHSFAWRAFAVGDAQVGSPTWRMNTGTLGAGTLLAETNSIFVNANMLARYVTAVRTERNAWHVDLVGHSMGGLISRLYLTLAPPPVHGVPVVRHLVMLGTPNLGSPCSVPLDLLGSGSVEAYRQLTPEVAAAFNRRVPDVPGVEYAILAGDPLPRFPCADGPLEFTENDGVVSVPSAFGWYRDRSRSRSLHTDMTGSAEDFRQFVLPRLAVSPPI